MHEVKTSVDSQGYRTLKRFSIDYTELYGGKSQLLKKNFEEDVMKKIEGEVEDREKIFIPRE